MRLSIIFSALTGTTILALPGGSSDPLDQGQNKKRLPEKVEIYNAFSTSSLYAQSTLPPEGTGQNTCNEASKCPDEQLYGCTGSRCICWNWCATFDCPYIDQNHQDKYTVAKCVRKTSVYITPSIGESLFTNTYNRI